MIAALLFFLGAISGARACLSDAECSYNGLCEGAVCRCDPGFLGDRCELLNVGSPDGSGGRNGLANHSSSWGGSVILDAATRTFHLFYARFELQCGLALWVNNSICVHAVSASALGPFEDVDVAIGSWCHGPKIQRAPDGTYLLFHLRQAADPKTRMCDCAAAGGSEAACIPPAKVSSSAPADGRGYMTFAHAKSLSGPWIEAGYPVLVARGSAWEDWVSNPSPFVRMDGSVLLAYRAWGTIPGRPGLSERIGLAAAPAWNGTYARVTDAFIATGEDPFVWVDARGHGHLLNHTLYDAATGRTKCGYAHYYSADLITWTATGVMVEGNLTWMNGTTRAPFRRERPELLFDLPSMRPRVLFGGVSLYPPDVTDESFTLAVPIL